MGKYNPIESKYALDGCSHSVVGNPSNSHLGGHWFLSLMGQYNASENKDAWEGPSWCSW